MFKNLIKTAFRNIFKDFGYSGLNILGLTLGIASALFLIIYISNELSYDKYHENAERIYRVASHIKETDDEFTWIVAQVPFAPQVVVDYPEVEHAVRFIDAGRELFEYEDKEFYEESFYYVDSNIFEVFTYELIKGNSADALLEPNTMVLTETVAAKYFGKEDPIGKTLVNGEDTYKVTGIIRDVPYNSHFRFEGLMSRSSLPKDFGNSWGNFGVYTYIMLPEGVDYKQFESKIQEMYDKYMAEIFESMGIRIEYVLDPILDIHLKSTYQGEPEPTGSYAYVLIFSIVALFLILIAAMNYMNLATARSTKRAREVGLRKVVGSHRGSLILQFIMESSLFTFISLVLSIVLVVLLMPQFNQLAGKSFEIDVLLSPVIIASVIGVIVVIGIFGGSYPAFYLSKFSPLTVMKGEITKGSSGTLFRKNLVVIQFTISVAMIVSTLVVFKQLNYLKTKDLGYNMDNVISLQFTTREMVEKYPVLKQALLENPNVKYVSSTGTRVGDGSGKLIMNVETDDGMQQRGINLSGIDHDFIETLGITMIKGRDFQEDMPSDTLLGVIVNETMAKRLNWSEPLGKRVELQGRGGNDFLKATVVGVMKDYHQTGMYNEIETLLFFYRINNRLVYAKISNKDVQETIRYIETKWNEIFPEQPFEYSFLSERFNEQFGADEKRGFIFTLFTVLAILIACLGLFGLASFTVEQRTKEIGIRKVVGATEGTVVRLISKEFLILTSIAIIIAFPLTFYFMQDWLQQFVYRTNLGLFVFILAGLITIAITFITISFQAWKAANTNPAESLRIE
ncbi:MAG: ABC transporter permease [Bacteroidales bacterium]|nr:ABC transporter permease [Bacteroidales bacterium]